LFVPVAIESTTIIGPQSMGFLRGEDKSFIYFMTRLPIAIQTGNPASVRGIIGSSTGLRFPRVSTEGSPHHQESLR